LVKLDLSKKKSWRLIWDGESMNLQRCILYMFYYWILIQEMLPLQLQDMWNCQRSQLFFSIEVCVCKSPVILLLHSFKNIWICNDMYIPYICFITEYWYRRTWFAVGSGMGRADADPIVKRSRPSLARLVMVQPENALPT
jgi:hypothetical protein